MLNATLYYAGSGGLVMNTISCVDRRCGTCSGKWLACRSTNCWAVRDEIQFYATGARPDLAQEMGFIGGKMPTHWGPHDGDAGIRKTSPWWRICAKMRPGFLVNAGLLDERTLTMPLAHACALITSSGSKSVCRRSSMKAIAS